MGKKPSNNWLTPKLPSGGGQAQRKTKGGGLRKLEDQICINWRTPAAKEPGIKGERLEGELGGRLYDKETGRNAQYGLSQQVAWPTPNTPSGGPTKDGSAPPGMNGGKGHREMLKGQFPPSARLNPDWVEQLMDVEVGWTQLSSAENEGDHRIDRLRLLGNGVFPSTAEKAFRVLFGRLMK